MYIYTGIANVPALSQQLPASAAAAAVWTVDRRMPTTGVSTVRSSAGTSATYASLQPCDDEDAPLENDPATVTVAPQSGPPSTAEPEPEAAAASGPLPAGCRLWFQMDNIDSSRFGGLLIVAFHWRVPDVMALCNPPSWDKLKLLVKPAAWHNAADFTGALPELALSSRIYCEVDERNVFVRPETHEVCMWVLSARRSTSRCSPSIANWCAWD